jgi:type I restriction enzyme S subunit
MDYNGRYILVARVGANAGLVYQINGKCGISDNTLIIEINDKNIFFDYFYSLLEFVELNRLIYGTGQPLVTSTMIKTIKHFFPPLPEQRAIAEILTTSDKLIGVKECLIAAKQKQKQWLMQNILTGKIRLPGFSGEWECVIIEKMFKVLSSLPLSRAELKDIGYCYLHYGDIHKMDRFVVDASSYLDKPRANIAEPKDELLLINGDIVFVDASEDYDGVCKYTVIKNDKNIKFISGLHTIHLRSINKKIDNAFKEFCFQNPIVKKQMVVKSNGMKVYGLSKAEILKLHIPLPPLPEQKAIAVVLTTADREIKLLKKELEQQKKIKKHLMQKLLTGKIRVKEGAGV